MSNPPADTTPPHGAALISVVATYHCPRCHRDFACDFVFDAAPPRHVPHESCPANATDHARERQ